jgi:hypothetical protein
MLEEDGHAILLWHGDVKVASRCISLKKGENGIFTRESLSTARWHSDLFKPTDEEEAEVLQSKRSHTRKKSHTELYRCIIGATHTGHCQAIDPGLFFKQGCRKFLPTKLSRLEQNCPRPSSCEDSTFLGNRLACNITLPGKSISWKYSLELPHSLKSNLRRERLDQFSTINHDQAQRHPKSNSWKLA